MPRYCHASRSTVVGTNARAMLSIFGTTTVRPVLREVGVFNTTVNAVNVALVRFTNATGVGTGLTEAPEDPAATAAVATVFAGHTADGGVGNVLRTASLGAAIGSGVIWTFGANGIIINQATADGVGVYTPNGTGQICDITFVWDE
jgi:hypothetical protein